jgi:glycosyltransferase involved in cell wall biosynthesis
MSWLDGRSIHQVVVTAAPGDAITNSVMEIRSLLRTYGKSEVFACNVHNDLHGDILSISDYDRHAPAEKQPLTLVHVSMGDDQLLPFVSRIAGSLIVSYHNITPSSYFAPWDAPTARLLKLGRLSLEPLRDRTVLALADSSFNAADLRDTGYPLVRVGGLILGVERLSELEPARLSTPVDGPIILSVGQLYPHKRPDLILAAFHELVTRHRPDASLVLAGSARLPAYAEAISHYVDRLGLASKVTVTGHISDEELVAWYRRADLFVVASEHEGFCVPLIEAMQFDIPIVARANGAVPETLGGAGVLVPGDTGPSTLATVIAAVLDDDPARDALRARGRERRRAFTAEACRRRFLEALEDLAP